MALLDGRGAQQVSMSELHNQLTALLEQWTQRERELLTMRDRIHNRERKGRLEFGASEVRRMREQLLVLLHAGHKS